MPKRFRFYAELEKEIHDRVVIIPRGMRKVIFSGLLKTLLDASPKTKNGELDLAFAFHVSQGKYELRKKGAKEDVGHDD